MKTGTPKTRFPWQLALIFILLSLGIGITGHFYYLSYRGSILDRNTQILKSIADLKTGRIAGWRQERMADIKAFSQDLLFIQAFSDFLQSNNADEEVKSKLINRLNIVKEQYKYHNICALDKSENIILQTNPDEIFESSECDRATIKQMLATGETLWCDFCRPETSGNIYLQLMTPIVLNTNGSSEPIGGLVFRINPYEFLYPMIQSWPVPSGTSETLLIRQEDHTLVFLNELRHQKNTALVLRFPVDDPRLPAAAATRGYEGVWEGNDYRGIEVLAYAKRIPDSPWFMIAKTDLDEIYAPLGHEAAIVISIIIILVILSGVLIGLFFYIQKKDTYKELFLAQAEIGKSRERLQQAMDNIKMIALQLDLDANILYCNDYFLNLAGYQRKEVIGKNWFDEFIPKQAENDVKSVFNSAVTQGKLEAYHENKIITSNGTMRDVFWNNTLLKDSEGNIIGTLSFGEDITDRKYLENKYQTIISTATDGFWILDSKTNLLEVNRAYCQMSGYNRDELLKMRVSDLSAQNTPEETYKRAEKIIEQGSGRFETRHKRKDGSIFDLEISARYLDIEGGRFFVFLRDITETKQAVESLKNSEERFRTFFESSSVGMIITDFYAQFLQVNHEACRMLGYTKEELMAKTLGSITYREDSLSAMENVARLLDGSINSYVAERRYIHKDGHLIWGQLNMALLRDQNNEPLHFICQLYDISERKQIEEALKKSEEKFHELADQLPEAVFELDLQGNFTYVNKAGLDKFGYTQEDVNRNINVTHLIIPEQRKQAVARMQRRFAGEELPDNIEYTMLTKNGTPIQSEVYTSLIIRNNITIGLRGFAIDITERKKAEEKLKDAKERYQTLFENASDAIYIHDLKGNILEVNQVACDRMQYTNEDFKRMNVKNLSTSRYSELTQERIDKLIQDSYILFESEHISKDGTIIPVEVNTRLINYDGKTVALGIVRDITQRKQAEKAIKQNEERLESLYKISRYKAGNVQDLLDFALEEAIKLTNSKIGYIYFYNKDKKEFTLNTWSKNVMKECSVQNPQTIYYLEKTGIWGEAIRQAKPIVLNDFHAPHPLKKGYPEGHAKLDKFLTIPIFSNQDIVAVVGVANKETDYDEQDIQQLTVLMDAVWKISESKKSEDERRKLQEQLIQAQKIESIGTLAGGIAHDFNNILQVITGYSEMMLSIMKPDDILRKNAFEIKRAAERASGLTKQLLAFSRKQEFKNQPVDLNLLINDLHKMLHRLIGEDIEIILNLTPNLNMTKADPSQIEQLITNLSINARDAMPDGGKLTIKTENVTLDKNDSSLHAEARPGDFVCLSITDTGAGMTKEVLNHIFEPFFTTKEFGKGTGLGLSVAYGIAKQHEGWINVYSEPGLGANFRIYLPAVKETGEEGITERVSIYEYKGSGQRILLVEDAPQIRDFAAGILSSNGYVVFDASNFKEAVEIFEKEEGNFVLLFSDVILPDKNGVELADELLKRNSDLKILLSSGYTDYKSQTNVIKEKGFDFIAKPYLITDLLKTIKEILLKIG